MKGYLLHDRQHLRELEHLLVAGDEARQTTLVEGEDQTVVGKRLQARIDRLPRPEVELGDNAAQDARHDWLRKVLVENEDGAIRRRLGGGCVRAGPRGLALPRRCGRWERGRGRGSPLQTARVVI